MYLEILGIDKLDYTIWAAKNKGADQPIVAGKQIWPQGYKNFFITLGTDLFSSHNRLISPFVLCSYHTGDLHLFVANAKARFSHDMAYFTVTEYLIESACTCFDFSLQFSRNLF